MMLFARLKSELPTIAALTTVATGAIAILAGWISSQFLFGVTATIASMGIIWLASHYIIPSTIMLKMIAEQFPNHGTKLSEIISEMQHDIADLKVSVCSGVARCPLTGDEP